MSRGEPHSKGNVSARSPGNPGGRETNDRSLGQAMYALCRELFPICRSITGSGVRQTLSAIQKHLPELKIHEVPSGTKSFDWTVPKEWNIRDAYVIDPQGRKIIDFRQSNLHVVGYSVPVDIDVLYSYLDRGSDERQYCSPGVDLPVVSVMRSKYGTYQEYHTSLDDLSLISPVGLYGGYEVLARCIECLEHNETLRVTVLCEPQMGRRGLYPTLSTRESGRIARNMMDLIAYCDGKNSLLEVAEIIGVPIWDLFPLVERLRKVGILETVSGGGHSA